MNGDEPPKAHWFFGKWPNWLKVFAAIGTVGGAFGTIFTLGGTVIGAVKSHDAAVKARTIADQELVERNKKIDNTLSYHGQQNWTMEKKLEGMDKKLDELLAQQR